MYGSNEKDRKQANGGDEKKFVVVVVVVIAIAVGGSWIAH